VASQAALGQEEGDVVAGASPAGALRLVHDLPHDQSSQPDGRAYCRVDDVPLHHVLLGESRLTEGPRVEPDGVDQPEKRQQQETSIEVFLADCELFSIRGLGQVHFLIYRSGLFFPYGAQGR